MAIPNHHHPTTVPSPARLSITPSPPKPTHSKNKNKTKDENQHKRKVCNNVVRFSDEIDEFDFEDPYSIDFSIWYNFKEHQASRKRDNRIVKLVLELTAGEKELTAGEKEVEEKLGETTRGLEAHSKQAGKRRKRSWETVQAIQSKTKGAAADERIAHAYATVSAQAARDAKLIAELDAAYVEENVRSSTHTPKDDMKIRKACNRTQRRRRRRSPLKFLTSRLSKALFQRQ